MSPFRSTLPSNLCMRRCSETFRQKAWQAFCLNVLRSSCEWWREKDAKIGCSLPLTSSLFPTLNWNKTKLYHQEGIQEKKAGDPSHQHIPELTQWWERLSYLRLFLIGCPSFSHVSCRAQPKVRLHTADAQPHANGMRRNQCTSTDAHAVTHWTHIPAHVCTDTHTYTHTVCQCGTQAEKMLTQCVVVVVGGRDNGAVGPSVERRENTHQSY